MNHRSTMLWNFLLIFALVGILTLVDRPPIPADPEVASPASEPQVSPALPEAEPLAETSEEPLEK